METEHFLRARIDEARDGLLRVSHSIHAKPETRFEEHHASAVLTAELEKAGFAVTRGVAGLPTAFVGEYGDAEDGPTLAVFLEYDALEDVGHGCGHNVIAAIGLGSALALKAWMEVEAPALGKILVIGSPGEEGGGGKNHVIKAGVLEGVDAAFMMHPDGESLPAMRTLGRVALDITFTGKAAHAAVTPHRGVNALDAAVLTLTAIGLLRQQLPDDVRVHAIIVEGGDAPNVIPARSRLRAFVRAEDTAMLIDDIQPRVENCARGAALATGAEVTIVQSAPTYASLRPNAVLGQLVEANMIRAGRTPAPARTAVFPGSTDMGNVSQVVPSIHPTIELVPDLGMHTREAADVAGGPAGDRAVVDGALILALTMAQVFEEPHLLDRVRADFTPGIIID